MPSLKLDIMHTTNPRLSDIKIEDERLKSRWLVLSFQDGIFSIGNVLCDEYNDEVYTPPSIEETLGMLRPAHIQQSIFELFGKHSTKVFYDAANSCLSEKFGDAYQPVELIPALHTSDVQPHRPKFTTNTENNIITIRFGAR